MCAGRPPAHVTAAAAVMVAAAIVNASTHQIAFAPCSVQLIHDTCMQLIYDHTHELVANKVFVLSSSQALSDLPLAHMSAGNTLMHAEQGQLPVHPACQSAGLCSAGEVLLQRDWR